MVGITQRPMNDAWQRKITGNALFSAEQIMDKFFKRQEISETKTTKKEEIVSGNFIVTI